MRRTEEELQPQYQKPGVPDSELYPITRRSRLSPSITGGRKPHLWLGDVVVGGLAVLLVATPFLILDTGNRPPVVVTPVEAAAVVEPIRVGMEAVAEPIAGSTWEEISPEPFQVTITAKAGVYRRDMPSQLGRIVGGLSADPHPMPGVFKKAIVEWDQKQVKGIWVSMGSGENVSYFALYCGGQSLVRIGTEDLAVANQPPKDAADYFRSIGLPLALQSDLPPQPNSAPVLNK